MSTELPRRRRRRGPRPAGPPPGCAHAAPRGRGAARDRPAGRRRDGAGGPRGAAAATSSAPVRSSRCCALPASPTCWSTAPTRSTSTAAPGSSRPAVRFPDDEAVRRLAQRLAASGGRRLDDASPYVDVRLADGTRCHAVLAPVAAPGTLISLRVPRPRGLQPRRAGRPRARSPPRVRGCCGAWSRRAAGVPGQRRHRLRQDHPARLAARRWSTRPSGWCSSRTPAELRPDHPHVVGLEARPPNIEGAGEITLRDPGPPGAADAARPAGGRRGARRRGGRAARRPQHRPRGRLRHPPRQLRGRRPRPDRGAGPGRRARPRRRAQPARLGRRRRAPPRPRGPTARARLREVAVPVRGADGLVDDADRRSSSPTTAPTGPGPAPSGWPRGSA